MILLHSDAKVNAVIDGLRCVEGEPTVPLPLNMNWGEWRENVEHVSKASLLATSDWSGWRL